METKGSPNQLNLIGWNLSLAPILQRLAAAGGLQPVMDKMESIAARDGLTLDQLNPAQQLR
jgi:hypothetical protein